MLKFAQIRVVLTPRPLPEYHFGGRWSTWEQERGEVLESILDELAQPGVGAERKETCFHLLQHLAQSSCRSNSSSRCERRGTPSVRPPKRHSL